LTSKPQLDPRNQVINRCLPAHEALHLRQKRDNGHCPNCTKPVEADNHFFRCPHPTMQDKRASKFKTFHDTLKDTAHTPRWVRQPIVHIVELWLADVPLINVTRIHKPHDISTVQRTLLYAAIQEQGCIGWDSLVRGRISTKWAKAMQPATRRKTASTSNNTTGHAGASAPCGLYLKTFGSPATPFYTV